MNFYEYVRDLKRSGYTTAQISEYIEDMFQIKLTDRAILGICSGATDKIVEYQQSSKRKWQRLLNQLPFEEFEKYYDPVRKEYDRKAIQKKYNWEHKDIVFYYFLYHNRRNIDWFNEETTKKIFEADNYTCRRCGYREDKMYTHHIMPGLGDHFENGVTVCNYCHIFLHTKRDLPKEFYDRDTWDDYIEKYEIIKRSYRTRRREQEEKE